MRKGIAAGGLIVVAIMTMGAKGCGTTTTSNSASTSGGTAATNGAAATAAPTTATTVPTRQVAGKAVTLGAGSFTGGTDVQPGLYDVTTAAGQSGNFIVQGTDTYDEVLGQADGLGVPKIRARISPGDSIKISGLSQVNFTPVTSPFVTTHALANLYAGSWTVGQDIGPGPYVATPGSGQSGNFIVMNEGVDEVLGQADGIGVPSVTVTLQKGDVITISGLSQVTMTPA